jgi:IMP dehydrogenase/GMP reductase
MSIPLRGDTDYPLRAPILSASMDAVTEAKMAIA